MKLIPFGLWHRDELQPLPRPSLHSAPSMNIVLRAIPGRSSGRRSASPIRDGQTLIAHRYGTPRCFPCSHMTSGTLTRRNKGEFPTVLHFDELHRAAVSQAECIARTVASPDVAEWLMGLPLGWTSTRPLARLALESHAIGQALAAGVPVAASTQRAGIRAPTALAGAMSQCRHATLSLFSGCGALDFALLAWCKLLHIASRMRLRLQSCAPGWQTAYCPLRRCMDIFAKCRPSTRDYNGFPCPDISVAGRRLGFAGKQSVLVYEALRLAGETQCSFIFMEMSMRFEGCLKSGSRCSLHWIAKASIPGGAA